MYQSLTVGGFRTEKKSGLEFVSALINYVWNILLFIIIFFYWIAAEKQKTMISKLEAAGKEFVERDSSGCSKSELVQQRGRPGKAGVKNEELSLALQQEFLR